MGIADKARNVAQDIAGKAKEVAGDVTSDDKLKAEGRKDQTAADLKQAGENVKDAFKK